MAKTVSFCQGKGSLSHNNRTFRPKNVDSSKSCNNITFIKIPIEQAYENCFARAVERYNTKQKRADRRIKDGYFHYAFSHAPCNNVIVATDKRKSFYEDIVQIGCKDDTGTGSPDAEIAAECLTEYIESFIKRNPNFYVFNAVLHNDEATPHLHIDYIPIGHYKRGVDTQNGLAQALKEMGHGDGENAISRWRAAEVKILTEICNRHGIEISEPQKSRGSLTVEQYKEYAEAKGQAEDMKQQVARLEEQAKNADKLLHHREELRTQVEEIIDNLDEQYQEKTAAIEHLDEQIAEKTTALTETTAELTASATKVTKIKRIDEIETGKTVLGGKITMSREDYGTLTDLAKKQLASEKKESELNAEITKLKEENRKSTEKNDALTQEIRSLYPLKAALRNAERERDSLKAKFQRVMEFIESLKLTQKLQEFLQPVRRGVRR